MSVPIAITGMGVVTSLGNSLKEFAENLYEDKTGFGILQRPGREGAVPFIGAELDQSALARPKHAAAARQFAKSTLAQQAAILVVEEAWNSAGESVHSSPPERRGIVIGGGNWDFREQFSVGEQSRQRLEFIRPSYAVSIWETDMLGLLSESFELQGEGFCAGAASASGNMAVIQAMRQLQLGHVDLSIAVAPLTDLSGMELHSLRNLGAMGGESFMDTPTRACRPFDKRSDGFIFGEGCAAVVLQRGEDVDPSQALAWLLGSGVAMAGRRGPASDSDSQVRAIRLALQDARMNPADIDYVNTHGTGSPHGDAVELNSLERAGLKHCAINSTKSLTGHCLTAAGLVETVATIVQIQKQRCHSTRNLEEPIVPGFRWAIPQDEISLERAVNLSFAFGGISTAIVLGKATPEFRQERAE